MEIQTNNHWRDFTYRHDMDASVLESEFDWLTEDDSYGFFRYRSVWYHVSMFLQIAREGWQGIHNDSAFSGVLIQVSDDGEQYKVATVYA